MRLWKGSVGLDDSQRHNANSLCAACVMETVVRRRGIEMSPTAREIKVRQFQQSLFPRKQQSIPTASIPSKS